jgi:hypothetical protein
MHPRVLGSEAWQVIKELDRRGLMQHWILAGGTGLALQVGHRYSEHLDLFLTEDFDSDRLLHVLSEAGTVHVHDRGRSTLNVLLEGLRLSYLKSQAAFLFDPIAYRGLFIADARDIALMKLVAAGGRGSRKDFVDLYFYFTMFGGLDSILPLLRKRYAGIHYNEYHVLKSLVYFEDAECEPMPHMIKKVHWKDIKEKMIEEVRRVEI